MRIAIVGAGAGGLAALRHSLDDGQQCVVFEQTGTVGGSWNYTDDVGLDENGLPIHTTMYKDLRLNWNFAQTESFNHIVFMYFVELIYRNS